MRIKKEITFICTDKAERSLCEPIATEARKRGYKVVLTDNTLSKCEIGFYCQHQNFPQCSKFSFIMLHDIIQQYGNWPDIWFREPWDKYDVGILPSETWEENWKLSSQYRYSRPRIGMFRIGWPKADAVVLNHKVDYRKVFNEKYGLDNTKKTVLYAPAWENDNKQDDFVRAMECLDVNILIKQAPWDSPKWLAERPDIYENCVKMQNLHKDIPNVTILDMGLNIFEAIAASDILVSEESSTMCEATMMGIPAVSVSDWLIPDVVPSRLPECNYNFVTMTTKNNLEKTIKDIISNYEHYKEETELLSKKNFSNIGNTSEMIMNIVDDCVNGEKIRYCSLTPSKQKHLSIKKAISHYSLRIKRELVYFYGVKYPSFGKVINRLRSIKNGNKQV